MLTPPPIILSKQDLQRLEELLDLLPPMPDLQALRNELARAEVVEPDFIPPDVITMNSTARFQDENSGKEFELTLARLSPLIGGCVEGGSQQPC